MLVEVGANTVSVAVVLPPLARVTGEDTVHVAPVAAVQLRLMAPLKFLIEAMLRVSAALAPAVTATSVACGVSVKSESGLAKLTSVDDGELVALPP